MMEIQKGLYLEIKSYFKKGKTHYLSYLTAADGYCFYLKDEEVYDENGNIIVDVKPHQRYYMVNDIRLTTDIEELKKALLEMKV